MARSTVENVLDTLIGGGKKVASTPARKAPAKTAPKKPAPKAAPAPAPKAAKPVAKKAESKAAAPAKAPAPKKAPAPATETVSIEGRKRKIADTVIVDAEGLKAELRDLVGFYLQPKAMDFALPCTRAQFVAAFNATAARKRVNFAELTEGWVIILKV